MDCIKIEEEDNDDFFSIWIDEYIKYNVSNNKLNKMEEILEEEGYTGVEIEKKDTWFKITEQKTGESFSLDQKKEKSLEILNLLKQHLSLNNECIKKNKKLLIQ